MSQQYLTGLDIGTHSLKAVVAEAKNDGELLVKKVLKTPSGGMRRGSIDDLGEMTRALNIMFGELKKVSKQAVKNLFLNVGGSDTHVQASRNCGGFPGGLRNSAG